MPCTCCLAVLYCRPKSYNTLVVETLSAYRFLPVSSASTTSTFMHWLIAVVVQACRRAYERLPSLAQYRVMQLWMQGIQKRDDSESFMSIISSFIPDPSSHLADTEAPHGMALM